MILGPHPSHKTRFSDASTFDEICVNCGAHDEVPGGWGQLVYPCPNVPKIYQKLCDKCGAEYDDSWSGDRCVNTVVLADKRLDACGGRLMIERIEH